MSIADALEGDIYVDTTGKLWRVMTVVSEPTVTVEEVEGSLYDPNASVLLGQGAQQSQINVYVPRTAEIRKTKRSTFTGDTFWSGWERIWRRPA